MSLGIAVVEPVGGHGGMNDYNNSLCRSLVQAGAKVTLFTCDKTKADGTEGFPVRRPYRGIYGSGREVWRGLRYLRGSVVALPAALLSGHRIVHFHFFQIGAKELFNVLLARLIGLRVVSTSHDVEAFKAGLSAPRLSRWVYRLSHRVIAHSQVAKQELIDRLGVPPGRIDVIVHGNYLGHVTQDITRDAARSRFGFKPDDRVVLFFGQIKQVKGLDVLLEGFALARKADPSLKLLIAGRVWKGDFSSYAQRIERLGLADACQAHVRYIPDDELPYFYRCADLVALPYRQIYQSGVVLQAMSYGLPVIVSSIPGMLEVIEDERTGFVFRSGDAVHLAQRLNEVFTPIERLLGVAAAGYQLVKTRHDWLRLGGQTMLTYQRVVSGTT